MAVPAGGAPRLLNAADVGSGSIELILGPMFSGKSTELLRRVRRHAAAAKICLMIKHKGDARYTADAAVITHDLTRMCALCFDKLSQAGSQVDAADVIAIDEGQFFPDVVEYAESWANSGKLVVIAALDGTWQRQPFHSILQLIPLAEDVCKLKAVCSTCQQDAAFTKRLTKEIELQVVGGAEKYAAVCRTCFLSRHGAGRRTATERNMQESRCHIAPLLQLLACTALAVAPGH